MKSRIWIILAVLLLCNVLGYALLMADSEARAAGLSAWGKPSSATAKAAAAPMAASAAFATITVNTRVDEGQPTGSGGNYPQTSKCSLREAIQSAENNTAVGGCVAGSSTGTDIIQITLPTLANDPGANNNEIDIERELPVINSNIDIVGGNPSLIIFQRSHAAGVPQFRVLTVNNTATASITGVTLCNGLGNMNGVGILNSGNLTLTTVRVFANNPDFDISGPYGNGTVYNSGTLTMDDCEVSQNFAGNGAGIFNAGTLDITRSIIGSNSSSLVPVGGPDTMPRNGGGLYNSNGTVTISRSVIRSNSASKGGGIFTTLGSILMTNCTMDGNVANQNGAAMHIDGTPVTLSSVTIAGHAAPTGVTSHDAAIYLSDGAELYYRNTIFGNYVDGANPYSNVFNFSGLGLMVSEGNNLSNDDTVDLDAGLNDLPSFTDPMMDPIATYGTVTENPDRIDTYRLQCGSPAINAGSDTAPNAAPATDARGVARIGLPDIGSYEFNYQITTPTPLANFTVGTAYTLTMTATGGATPYFWTVSTGNLPPGLSLDGESGVISGTPTSGGTYNFTISVGPLDLDTGYCSISKAFTLIGSATCGGAFTFSPASLPATALGAAYSQTVSVTAGGTPNYSFSLDSGTLPTGLSLAANGAITGTPTFPGVFNFVVKATDANMCTGTKSYSITVGCGTNQVTVSPATLANGTTGTPYSQTVTSNRSPVTFSVSAGSLPTGLSLNPSTGAILGSPTAGGTFNFTIMATYGNAPNTCTGTRAYTVTIACQTVSLSASPATFPSATCDSAYTTSPTLTASGGTGPYTFALSAGSLPAGLALTTLTGTTAKVTGTPTVVVSNQSFTVRATDANGCSTTQAYTITVGCPTITVSVPGVTTATAGTNFSRSFTSNKAGSSFALASGTLPTGVSLSSAGVLSGTPTQSGSFPITVTATVGTCSGTSATYTLVVSCPTVVVSPATLPNGTVNAVYPNQQFSATPNTLTYSYSVVVGALPTGLTLSSAGLLSGTPSASGTFNFTIRATSAGATGTCTGQQAFTVTIASNNTAPTFGTTQTVARQKGSPAGAAVTIATVSDAQTAAGSLTVTQISDPAATATGITVTNIVNTNGTITALVSAACNATAGTVCLQVSDGSLTTKGVFNVTLTDNTNPTLTYGTVNPLLVGTGATVNPATGPSDSGSISSIVLQSVTPSVSAGAITVNNTTGVITVLNNLAIGQYVVTVRATDNCGATTDAAVTLNVIGSLLVSEFALSGPNGQNDWFVELFNNTASVQYTTNLNIGFVNAAGTYVTVNLPANGTIQPRGYYLVVGSTSSLTGVTANHVAAALPGGYVPAGVALARGAVDLAANRLDSAGMNNLPGGQLYIESAALPWLNGTTRKHSFVRKSASSGYAIDTNNNQVDFQLVAPDTTAINGVTPFIGLPGPQSTTSPAVNNFGLPVALVDPAFSQGAAPNAAVVTESGFGTTRSLYLRRAITNNSGNSVKKLRFRIVEMSTGGTNIANLRALTSLDTTVVVNGQNVAVKGLQLEDAASQPNGGGINSTLCEGTITLAAPLAAGAKVNVQFRLGIIAGGSYKFVANVEAQN